MQLVLGKIPVGTETETWAIGSRVELLDASGAVLAQWALEWRGDGVHFPEDTAAYAQRNGVPVRVRFVAYDNSEMCLHDADRGDGEDQWVELLIDDGKPLRKNQIVELEFEQPELEAIDISRELEGALLQFIT